MTIILLQKYQNATAMLIPASQHKHYMAEHSRQMPRPHPIVCSLVGLVQALTCNSLMEKQNRDPQERNKQVRCL